MKTQDSLIKYFFILGLSKTEKLKLSETKDDPKQTEKSIEILSSYSVEGETTDYNLLKEHLRKTSNIFYIDEEQKSSTDTYLRSNIFPIKADYLDDIDFETTDENPLKNKDKIDMFKDYIYVTDNINDKPKHFFHCFKNQLDDEENPEKIILYNYGVLIFYENIVDEKDIHEERSERSKNIFSIFKGNNTYKNIFVAKALILISENPIFSLMKEILENIYNNFIQKRYISFPLEPLIIDCLTNINNNIKEITFSENNIEKIYKFHKQPILPFCDLNLLFFFKIFSLKDIFLLGEFYLLSKKIIIFSSNLDYLYPIYHILMTLFHPLNIYVQGKFYKLLTPDNIYFLLLQAMIPFVFIHTEKDFILKSDLIEKILNVLRESDNDSELLIYEINDKSLNEVDVKRHIFYKNKNIDINEITKASLIEKVLSTNYQINIQNKMEEINYTYLIESLELEISNLLNKYKDNHINNFYDFSIDYSEYETIRELFFGVMIKFIVLPIEPVQLEILNDTLQIKTLEIKNIFNKRDKESIDDFISTEQTDILYKNGIVRRQIKDASIIRNKILMDYYVKISFIDFKRQFFELRQQKNIVDEGKINSETNKKSIIENINFNNFFVYENKNQFYYFNKLNLHLVKFPQKDYNDINYDNCFIKYLNIYQEVTNLDLSKEINELKEKQNIKNHLDLGIYFGENFNLFFDSFICYKDKKSKKNNEVNLGDSDTLKNKNFKIYYKLILDEAEIFHDLFITQSLIINSREELAACAVGLYISIYIINLISEKQSPQKQILIESFLKKLYKLFEITKCFYGKFDFLITLLYQIIVSQTKYKKEYLSDFLNKLQDNKITPSIIILLMYNDKHQHLDFEYLKEIYKLDKSQIFVDLISFARNSIYNTTSGLYDENENNKEIIITKIKKIEHEHEFESDDIYGDYHCKNNDCCGYMNFYIENNLGNKEHDNVINPKYIINNLFKNILEENSLFIFPNNNMINEINQIAMYDELYFKIGYFQN